MNQPQKIFCRIVTGHDTEGNAVIASEAPPVRSQLVGGPGGPTFIEVWQTLETPALIHPQPQELEQSGLVLAPPQNGTRIRVIEFPPEGDELRQLTGSEALERFQSIGGGHASTSAPGAPHPLMHRTKTVDYGIVLEGEMTLIVDRGETTIRAGDIVIQNGTNHAWANRSGKICRMAFVLIDGQYAPEKASSLNGKTVRVQPIPPDTLGLELRHVHDEIANLVGRSQGQVTMINAQGALTGPFPPMLQYPQFGIPALTFLRSLDTQATLDKAIREVAILTVGAAFGARFEIYVHEIMAATFGLSPDVIAALAAGGRPYGLTVQQAIAHDVALSLITGHTLPASTYNHAVNLLGRDGVAELFFLIGGYSLIAAILNGFDIPAPDPA